MMTFLRALAVGLVLSGVVGCEPGPPKPTPGPETPHGGLLVPIPDGRGYVEVLRKSEPGRKPQSRIVAYFLGPDRKPLASPPKSATLRLASLGSPLDLKPAGEDGGLTSDPLPDRDDWSGELSASVDGKSVMVSISIR